MQWFYIDRGLLCWLLCGLAWVDLQKLKSKMKEMSGEFNQDTLGQIVCIISQY